MAKETFEDSYHRTSILGDVADIPTQDWLDAQEKPTPTGGLWYHAYPLSGGATIIHQSDITNKRPTTLQDLYLLAGGKFNPASKTVLTMFGLE